MKKLFAILAFLMLVGCPIDSCDSDGITSPDLSTDGGQQPDPIPEPKPEPVTFNPGPVIDVMTMDGASGFGLCSHDEMSQKQYWRSLKNRGYGYARVLSESYGWKNNSVFFSAAGQKIKYGRREDGTLFVKEEGALEEFRECLRIAAEEGMGVLMMGLVTSSRSKGDDERRAAWLRAIAKVGEPFNNVAWEVANEAWHPRSSIDRGDFLNRMYELLKRVSGGQWVSQDQNIGAKFANTARYRYNTGNDIKWKSDVADFHPWRFPKSPDRDDIRDILKENNGRALLSETTSYTNDPADLVTFGRLVTMSQREIQNYMNDCDPRDGCAFVYHCIECLFAEGRITWMPQRGVRSETLLDGKRGTGEPLVDWSEM